MTATNLLWPHDRLAEAAALLCAEAGLGAVAAGGALPPPPGTTRALAAFWIGVLQPASLEAEPVVCSYAAHDEFVLRAAPAIVAVASPPGEPVLYVALLGARHGRVRVIAPGGEILAVSVETLRNTLWAPVEGRFAPFVDQLLDEAAVTGRQRARARRRLLADRIDECTLPAAWLLRLSPGAAAGRHGRRLRLPPRVLQLVAANVGISVLSATAWVALGSGALSGRVEAGWLALFLLLLATALPLRWLQRWIEGRAALDIGALLKQRLLLGALRVDPDAMRHMGAGQLLARVLESEVVEAGLLAAGFAGVTAGIDLAVAAWVLYQGPGSGLSLLAFVGFLVTTIALSAWMFRRLRAATVARLSVTHDLVERLLGHRTRKVQQDADHLHDGEDDLLAGYLERSAAADRASVALSSVLTTAWLVVGMAAMGGAIARGGASPGAMAIGIGGLLLAQQALARFASALVQLGGLRVAWEQVGLLHRAASVDDPAGARNLGHAASGSEASLPTASPLLECRGVGMHYPGRSVAALAGCDLAIHRGDQVLVEGPSGGGKSSLVQSLLGLREPTTGTVLLDGLDRQSHGAEGWRARVTGAPQFHANHVFGGTLAFNLLLGRGWPATPADLDDAEQVCRELGLGPLLERMPAGINQMVGETGWQLSHGERSRLFLARALLQGGEVFVFDESFAALDPETLREVMPAVRRRAPTMVVVAHP